MRISPEGLSRFKHAEGLRKLYIDQVRLLEKQTE